MKIAFAVHDYRKLEGHSRYVAELASRFAGEHEVHVFANRIEADPDTRIHFHKIPAWRGNALGSIFSFAVMARFVVRGRFDIIHSQGFCGLRANVYTAHICNRAWDTALRHALGRLSFHEWLSGRILSLAEHCLYRSVKTSHIIAVSERLAADLRRCHGCTAPITVIYHGVDAGVFIPAWQNPARAQVRNAWDISHDEPVFLFVGDMRKGARQCIEAISRLPVGKLLFVSRTPKEWYESMASRFGVAGRVLFAGASEHVEDFYAAADALVLPTHYDSFAMVVTEAMASSLPAIVSCEAGVSELLEHGINGLVLKNFADVGELAGHMRALIDDTAFARRLGAAARRTAEEHSWDRVARQTLRVYEEILLNMQDSAKHVNKDAFV